MIKFVSLIEQSAPVKRYERELGFKLGDFRSHLRFLNYYRTYIEMNKEIKELTKKKRGATTLVKARINMEIRKLRTEWRPKLVEAKRNR